MKITCIQCDPIWQDDAANVALLTRQFANHVIPGQVDVVVLPELFHSGFSMDTATVGQSREGVVYQTLSQLANIYSVTLIAGVALKDKKSRVKPPKNHSESLEAMPIALNVAFIFSSDGTEQACYIKNYAFSLVDEQRYYQPDNNQVVFKVGQTSCSVFICYDLRFPELFRKVAQQTQVMFVIASWPSARQTHWQALLTARAIENQCFVVGVNRIGKDGKGVLYEGGSRILSPLGETLCVMDERTQVQSYKIETDEVPVIRRRYPFLQDMKPT